MITVNITNAKGQLISQLTNISSILSFFNIKTAITSDGDLARVLTLEYMFFEKNGIGYRLDKTNMEPLNDIYLVIYQVTGN